jgi:hypothetical protein
VTTPPFGSVEAAIAAGADRIAIHDEMIRGVRMGTTCALHAHREWVPMEDHHVWPKGMGGPDIAANKIRVCANAHYTIHAYFDLLIRYGEQVPADQRKHFSPGARHWATTGWTEAGSPRKGTS